MEYRNKISKLRCILSSPFIYSLILPLIILDLFVEIYHDKKLLGKGRVSESGSQGWDKSDLPQRNSRRPYWLGQFEKINQKAADEAWEFHKKGKHPPSNAIGRIVEEGDWLWVESETGKMQAQVCEAAIRAGNLAMYYPEANKIVPANNYSTRV